MPQESKPRNGRAIWALLTLILALSYTSAVYAQDSTPSDKRTASNQSDASQASSASSDTSDTSAGNDSSAPIPALTVTEIAPIRSVGAARLLDSTSQLRWKDFSVGTISYLQAFERIDAVSGGTSTIANDNISLFSTEVVFDKVFRRSRLVLQYHPRAMVFNGALVSDLLNQDLQANTFFILSPRWTLGLGNNFTYLDSRDNLGEALFDADTLSGTTLQNNFLQGTGKYLAENASSSFNYLWSARTKLSISPSFTYEKVTGGTEGTGSLSSKAFSLLVNASHDLSVRTSIGAYDRTEILTSGTTTFGRTVYYDFGGSVSQLVGTTWHLGASLGLATAGYASGRQWSESASASILKSFQRSYIALAYSRGQVVSGYITNQLGDRIDITARAYARRRLQFGAGAGYQREITGTDGIWGKYASGEVGYQITRSLSWTADYVHRWQRGNDVQVLNGNANLVSFGLSWDPRPQPNSGR